jgi:hypothetical protein
VNKFIFFSLILVLLFSFLACYANSTTGLIVVTNTSDVDAKNVKVGNNIIGTVGRGQEVNFYYVIEQTNSAISADGFTRNNNLLNGTIDLLYNHIVTVRLYKQGTSLLFDASGTKVGGTGLPSETYQMQ